MSPLAGGFPSSELLGEKLPECGGSLLVPLVASHLPLSRWTMLSCWPSLAGRLQL